jgi:glycosyltransferase involved in cell wall biosynthesis
MISVCLATFNGEKYIKEQLNSILSQIGKDDEIIISDDGSTDNTLNVISAFRDDRIKVYFNSKSAKKLCSINLITSNFENALTHAKGDLIFLADQDDVWLDNKVECCVKYLQEYDYVVSDCLITDQYLNVIQTSRFYKGSGFTKNRWKALFAPTPYQGSCAAFHKNVLMKSLPFPDKIQSHDRWIGYVASFFFSYKILPESLILYRRHEQNSSTATEKSRNNAFYKVTTRFRYIYELMKLKVINK